jgi:hypothetical protein
MRKLLTLTLLALALPASGQSFGTFSDVGFMGSRLAGAVTSQSAYVNTLTNGLLGYWRMDFTDNWTNEVSTSYTWAESGTILTSVTAISTNSANFANNSANYLTLADDNIFSILNSNSMSWALWVELDVTNALQLFIGKETSTDGAREWRFSWSSTGNGFYFGVYTNNSSASYNSVARNLDVVTGTWYLLIGEIDCTNRTFSLTVGGNGTLYDPSTSGVMDGLGGNTTTAVYMSKYPTANFVLDGRVDEVMFWRRTLTSEERTALWNGGSGRFYPFD